MNDYTKLECGCTAVSHCPEPHHACYSAGEDKFAFLPSRDDCSHQCNTCMEQASFSSGTKRDDTFAMSCKKQRDVGRFEAMKYFKQEEKMDKFTWSVLIFES